MTEITLPRIVPAAPSRVYVRNAATIKPKPVDYLWRGRIARGKLTGIGGDPGAGKGTLGIDIAARLSRGEPWPDGQHCTIGRTWLLTPEDNPEDTIAPRLIAAGADRGLVGVVDTIDGEDGKRRRINLETDGPALIADAARMSVDMVVIDPLSSYLGANINSWRDSDMRRILDPLAEAASKCGVAVILVAHLTKASGSKALYRFQGSIATVGAARFAFLVAPHPEDPELRVFACAKANVIALAPSLTFRVVPHHVAEINDEIGRIEWIGSTPLSADDLTQGAQDKGGSALERAKAFLLEHLAAGPKHSDDVKRAASAQGIGKNTLWDGKEALAIVATKRGLEGWDWRLPEASRSDHDASGRFKASRSDHDASGRFNSNLTRPPVVDQLTSVLVEASRSIPNRHIDPPSHVTSPQGPA